MAQTHNRNMDLLSRYIDSIGGLPYCQINFDGSIVPDIKFPTFQIIRFQEVSSLDTVICNSSSFTMDPYYLSQFVNNAFPRHSSVNTFDWIITLTKYILTYRDHSIPLRAFHIDFQQTYQVIPMRSHPDFGPFYGEILHWFPSEYMFQTFFYSDRIRPISVTLTPKTDSVSLLYWLEPYHEDVFQHHSPSEDLIYHILSYVSYITSFVYDVLTVSETLSSLRLK